MRVQARQTESGRVEVRAQSNTGGDGGDWTTHTPEARFLPTEPEIGRWYSSDLFAVSAPAAAPDVSDPAEYTQTFVEQAIDHYERHGRQATIEYYQTSESTDGQWYVFIFDEADVIRLSRESGSGRRPRQSTSTVPMAIRSGAWCSQRP